MVLFPVVWCELKVVHDDRGKVVLLVAGDIVWKVGVLVDVRVLALGSFVAFSIGEEHAQQVFAWHWFRGVSPVVSSPALVVVDVIF